MTFVPLRRSPRFSCHSPFFDKDARRLRASVCLSLYLSTLHPPSYRTYSVVCVKIYMPVWASVNSGTKVGKGEKGRLDCKKVKG